MPASAAATFRAAEAGQVILHVPAMVLAEILYLSERGKIRATLDSVRAYLDSHQTCRIAPLSLEVIDAAERLSSIPEPHDRLIAATATATALQAPLITNDTAIAGSGALSVIW